MTKTKGTEVAIPKPRKAVAYSTRVGHPLAPDPIPADYRQEISEQVLAEIDKECDQGTLAGGQPIEKFEW